MDKRQTGSLKWYDAQKGYGFVLGDDGADYYIHKSEITSAALSTKGEPVSFIPAESSRGLCAQSLVFDNAPVTLAQASSPKTHPDAVMCRHCNQSIVPKMVFFKGSPHNTICPLCAKEVKNLLPPFTQWMQKTAPWFLIGWVVLLFAIILFRASNK